MSEIKRVNVDGVESTWIERKLLVTRDKATDAILIRQPGFYFVKKWDIITVGELQDDGDWYIIGGDGSFSDDEFQWISKTPIPPPNESEHTIFKLVSK